jgi:hypothetical protein
MRKRHVLNVALHLEYIIHHKNTKNIVQHHVVMAITIKQMRKLERRNEI